MPKNNHWRPSASMSALQARSQLLTKIRAFFASRDILEVETPLLANSTITDPNIHSLAAKYHLPDAKKASTLYLQTSPEFAMKRLLAANSGSIYQICKAFRDEERGKQHNPEFTILEWYHVEFNHHDLMREMDEFLNCILNTAPAEKLSYAELFNKYLHINPHNSSIADLKQYALQNGLNDIPGLNRDDWLNILLTHFIEPHLGKDKPTFIYDFPASQAALARLNPDNPNIAERFEVFVDGTEIANGFHELNNSQEQRQRFLEDLHKRQKSDLPGIPLDENFLAAVDELPDCAGVALGVDRLLMLSTHADSIEDVLAFPIEKA